MPPGQQPLSCGSISEHFTDKLVGNDMDAKLMWIWLAQACGQGSRTAIHLLCAMGSPEKIYKADRKALAKQLGEKEFSLLNRLSDKDLSDASSILRRCQDAGVQILTPDDPQYPRTLYQLRDAPLVLYCVGKLPDFESSCCCAVVGTRTMSDYGKRMAYDVGRGIGAGGAVLVSGLALGVDGMSMAGALSAGGVTVGVLGCGIDIVYPPEHKQLMQRVLQDGAVITEYPPGTPPNGYHFPKRNRIISGLCQAVTVVEGDLKSGSLITARHALYQGKDLYAVPGMIGDAGAAGPNSLIKNGARAITSAADILKNYEFLYPHSIRMAAIDAALAASHSPDDATDVAVRMNVSAKNGNKYYGDGLYGGKKAKAPRQKRLPAKKVVERFNEGSPAPKKNVIPSAHVELDTLGETERKVYEAMIPDVPVVADDIPVAGIGMGDLMAAVTMLELAGVVECGAGGYYLRRSAEEVPSPDVGEE